MHDAEVFDDVSKRNACICVYMSSLTYSRTRAKLCTRILPQSTFFTRVAKPPQPALLVEPTPQFLASEVLQIHTKICLSRVGLERLPRASPISFYAWFFYRVRLRAARLILILRAHRRHRLHQSRDLPLDVAVLHSVSPRARVTWRRRRVPDTFFH